MKSTATSPHTLTWKERQRQERETLILQAAQDVLVEKGFHEMSMDEIAVRVGIAKGTVYLHFPSKEDLLITLFERDIRQLLETIETAIADQPTPRARLEAVLQFIYGEFFNKRIQTLYMIYNSAELRKLFEDKRMTGCMQESWRQLTDRVAALLDEGKAAGEFDSTIPTPVMRNTFFSLLTPKSYDRLVAEDQIAPAELVKHLSRLYFKGIAARERENEGVSK
ncbi:MAG TPA: TetR/AcrR family transcriptional regulator [Ktedonobacteraceae bacterium]|nr:TetR/AcrR family transcriptional regulator [Ktedonobacteraceae bacterium]